MPDETKSVPPKNKLNISLDLRVIIVLLLMVIAGMLVGWKPWERTTNNSRIITVTGEAKITAVPDQFNFYPSYEFTNTDKQAALTDLGKKSAELIDHLKTLGVPENKIKTDANGYNQSYAPIKDGSDNTYTLSLTVEAGTKELAQKVQDYLAETAPLGAVSPQPTFSDTKRKELESKARDEATKEARVKADQSAKNLGFKVGSVKSVTDGSGFGDIIPLESGTGVDSVKSSLQLGVHPGENDITYTVTVTYFVR